MKKFSFCYGHRLPDYIGKCERVHGHNAELEVYVSGSVVTAENIATHPGLIKNYNSHGIYNGMIMDFGDLKKIVNEILEGLDQMYLNNAFREDEDVVFDESFPPTSENIAHYIYSKLTTKLRELYGVHIYVAKIRLSETPTSWVEVTP
jgi:6-pyruvoyltetrahydropterin/6-carboxytetrahydropterin synthase